MRRTKDFSLLVLMFIVSGCAHVTAAQSPATAKPAPLPPVRADTTALRHTLDSIADAHHGVVGYSVIDLDNDVRLSRRGDETFPTASLIKLAILVTVYDLASKGDLSLDDLRDRRPQARVERSLVVRLAARLRQDHLPQIVGARK